MYLGNRITPAGCNPLGSGGRIPVVKVTSGDSWEVSTKIVAADGGPASPSNSFVEFVLSENQFSPPLWTGTWNDGVFPQESVPGKVNIVIPRSITKSLRRGSYQFSMRVSDRMRNSYKTQLVGHFLLEYQPSSDQHSIPYRDGTSDKLSGDGSQEQAGSILDISEKRLVPQADATDEGKVLMAVEGYPRWRSASAATDYEGLANKPSIGGVTLVGNKTLSDLSIQGEISDLETIRSLSGTALQPTSDLDASKLASGTVPSARLPLANGSERGAVNPSARDASSETQEVKVDPSTGKLYTNPQTDVTWGNITGEISENAALTAELTSRQKKIVDEMSEIHADGTVKRPSAWSMSSFAKSDKVTFIAGSGGSNTPAPYYDYSEQLWYLAPYGTFSVNYYDPEVFITLGADCEKVYSTDSPSATSVQFVMDIDPVPQTGDKTVAVGTAAVSGSTQIKAGTIPLIPTSGIASGAVLKMGADGKIEEAASTEGIGDDRFLKRSGDGSLAWVGIDLTTKQDTLLTDETIPSVIAQQVETTVRSESSATNTNLVTEKAVASALAGKQATLEYDDSPTESSVKIVKSGGIWSWVKSLLPSWLTSSYAEPATVESVSGKIPKISSPTANAVVLANSDGTIASSGKTIATTLGDDNTTVPTSKAVRDWAGDSQSTFAGTAAQAGTSEIAESAERASYLYPGGSEDRSLQFSDTDHRWMEYCNAGERGMAYVDDIAVTPWISATSYVVNSHVSYNGALYVCKTANSDATFDETKWIAYVKIEELAPAYSSSSTYAVGAFCSHGGKIYQCTTQITTAHAWNASEWAQRDLTSLFTSDNRSYNGSVMKISADADAQTIKAYIDAKLGNIETALQHVLGGN